MQACAFLEPSLGEDGVLHHRSQQLLHAAFLIAATQFSNMLGIQKCTKLKGVGECNLYANATALEADTTGFSYYSSSQEGSHSKYTEHRSMMPSST